MIKLFLGVAIGLAIGYYGCIYYLNNQAILDKKENDNDYTACTM